MKVKTISSARMRRDGRRFDCGPYMSGFWKPIIWDKQRIGMGYHYRSRYEMILFFEKGKRRLNDLSIPVNLIQTQAQE